MTFQISFYYYNLMLLFDKVGTGQQLFSRPLLADAGSTAMGAVLKAEASKLFAAHCIAALPLESWPLKALYPWPYKVI